MTVPWFKRPINPSKWDDEFEGDRIHPKWTQIENVATDPAVEESTINIVNNNNALQLQNIHRFKASWIYRQPAGQGVISNVQGYYQEISDFPNECFILMRGGRSIRRASAVDGDSEISLRITDEGSNYILIMWDCSGSIVEPLFARSTASLGYLNLGLLRNYFGFAEPAEYLGIQKMNNTYHGWFASSGGNWTHMGSFTHTVALPRLWLTFANVNAGSPGTSPLGVDFLRVYPGIFPL